MRLTLLWSQSTTGNYFEEESALSIGFHFGNCGRRRAGVLNVLNCCTFKQQNQTCALFAASVSRYVGKVKSFETTHKYDTFYFLSGICCTLSLPSVSWDGAGL